MTRVFDAPRDLVFDALTKPDLVKRWLLGPPGWSMPVCEIDLKVGGKYRYVWRNEDGREMGMGGTYREIVRPAKLVHTELFDEARYAGESLNTWTLTEKNGTVLSVTTRYEIRETRDDVLKSGMETGVAASYDRLDEILASARSAKR
ncbi:MAG: SRPBCC family protein [Verrucomicrobiota bacterium]|nr:SRPBCC family protein [Verrucomicrobiota bacterium]